MADYMRDKIDQYDIMHDNQTLCYGMLDVRDMGLPVVGTIHHPITKDRRIDIAHAKWPWIKFLKWRWYSFLNMQIKVARALDPLIVVSDSTRRDVHTDFKIPMERMVRIHHGIDHELFTPQPHITRRKNRLMATASADVPLKGLIYLIRAYHMLLADHPDLELVVVGRLREGQTMDELNRLAFAIASNSFRGFRVKTYAIFMPKPPSPFRRQSMRGSDFPPVKRCHAVCRWWQPMVARCRKWSAMPELLCPIPTRRHWRAPLMPCCAMKTVGTTCPSKHASIFLIISNGSAAPARWCSFTGKPLRPRKPPEQMQTIDLDILRLEDGHRILDLGCGRGRHTHAAYFHRRCHSVGLDLGLEDVLTTQAGFWKTPISNRKPATRAVMI